jgi:hypothetical protein
MNFCDIYLTMTYIPDGVKALNTICTFLGCANDRDTLKQALWGRCSRVEHPGMFPFDEETGRIYDSLWKAAAAENYSTPVRLARWFLRTICPPADDEGPESFMRKAHPPIPDDDAVPLPDAVPIGPPAPEWEVADDDTADTQAGIPPARPAADAVKRRSKKTD